MNDNCCPICHDELDDDIQILNCGHKFHYECIKLSYINSAIQNTSIRCCPYCRSYGGYLELKKNSIPLKNLHQEYNLFIKNAKNNNTEYLFDYLDKDKCLYILTSGPNKGLQCKCKPVKNNIQSNIKYSDNYCKTHLKKMISKNKIT